MTKVIGWVLFIGAYVWFSVIALLPLEETLTQAIGTASMLIAGAILAK